MDTYKIAIDTFLAEISECKTSGCAVFSGGRHRVPRHPAAHAPEQVRAAFHGRTHHAFHPPCSILSIEKPVLRDIQSTEYKIITKEGGTITLDVF